MIIITVKTVCFLASSLWSESSCSFASSFGMHRWQTSIFYLKKTQGSWLTENSSIDGSRRKLVQTPVLLVVHSSFPQYYKERWFKYEMPDGPPQKETTWSKPSANSPCNVQVKNKMPWLTQSKCVPICCYHTNTIVQVGSDQRTWGHLLPCPRYYPLNVLNLYSL